MVFQPQFCTPLGGMLSNLAWCGPTFCQTLVLEEKERLNYHLSQGSSGVAPTNQTIRKVPHFRERARE